MHLGIHNALVHTPQAIADWVRGVAKQDVVFAEIAADRVHNVENTRHAKQKRVVPVTIERAEWVRLDTPEQKQHTLLAGEHPVRRSEAWEAADPAR